MSKPTLLTSGTSDLGTKISRRRRLFPARVPKRPAATSKFVAFLKLLLPAAAIAIIALTFAWPQLMPEKGKFRLGETSINDVGFDGVVMQNPRYFGVDEQKRAYQVSASSAVQKHQTDDLILLKQPKADIFLRNSSWLALSSEDGIYYRSLEKIELFGGVQVYYDKGFELKTQSMKLDLRRGTAASDTHVSGHGMSGEFTAEGFQIRQRGESVLFSGKSQVILRASGENNS